MSFVAAARQGHRAGRPVGRRQVDGAQSAAALLRGRRRPRSDRRPEHRRGVARARCASRSPMSARSCTCSAARSARTSRSAGSAPARPKSSPPPKPRMRTISSWASRRLRHPGRRARHAALRRPAPAHRDRARADQERADHPARRGDRGARFGIRASRAGSASPNCAKAAPRSSSPTGCPPSCTPTAILVVEAGQVVESGRHDELLRKDGRYASFYRLQLREQSAPAQDKIVEPAPVPEIAPSV